jgi:hypothetical protein
MSANLIPITSDGGFVTGGNITVSLTTVPSASPAPSINGFSSATFNDFVFAPNISFSSNVYNVNGFTISTLPDIGGQVDYNNHTVGYVADNNGSASLYARDSAGLGDNNAVVTANATNGKVTLLAANTTTNQTWTFDGAGNLTLPGNTFSVNYANGTQVSLGGGSYGDSNVATLLSSFGSNTITTTGNVTVGDVVFGANTGQVAFHTGAYISGNGAPLSREGSIVLQPYTGAGSTFPGVVIGGAGRLIAPNGSVSQIFNTADVTFQVAAKVTVGTASTTTTNGALIVTGGTGISGNLNVGGNIAGNTAGFAIGYRDIPQVAASNTTLGATDGGKHYYSTTAGNLTLTIPNNATTSFATGTAISIVVQAAGNILVNAASGVTLYVAGNSTAANRVVGAYGMATLMKVASDTWFINGTGVS